MYCSRSAGLRWNQPFVLSSSASSFHLVKLTELLLFNFGTCLQRRCIRALLIVLVLVSAQAILLLFNQTQVLGVVLGADDLG